MTDPPTSAPHQMCVSRMNRCSVSQWMWDVRELFVRWSWVTLLTDWLDSVSRLIGNISDMYWQAMGGKWGKKQIDWLIVWVVFYAYWQYFRYFRFQFRSNIMFFACDGDFLVNLKNFEWGKKQTVCPNWFAEMCEEFTRFHCSQFVYFCKHSGYCMNAGKIDG